MKEIKWVKSGDNNISAIIGRVYLGCFGYLSPISGNRTWFADASINELSMMMRNGPTRKSLSEAKEDAVRLARELLLDGHAALVNEMKNFDLLEDL